MKGDEKVSMDFLWQEVTEVTSQEVEALENQNTSLLKILGARKQRLLSVLTGGPDRIEERIWDEISRLPLVLDIPTNETEKFQLLVKYEEELRYWQGLLGTLAWPQPTKVSPRTVLPVKQAEGDPVLESRVDSERLQRLEELERRLGVVFGDKALLHNALIHRSYLNEFQSGGFSSNERLEFLGDSVLGFLATAYLYESIPDSTEGELTDFRSALVRGRMLAEVAAELKLGEFLWMSFGEQQTGGRNRNYLLANALEAVIGALFLDQGVEAVKEFVTRHILVRMSEVLEKSLYRAPKSYFQEIAQRVVRITPTYQVLSQAGPTHNPHFVVGVYLEEKLVAEGEGNSKKNAENAAASKAIELWEKEMLFENSLSLQTTRP